MDSPLMGLAIQETIVETRITAAELDQRLSDVLNRVKYKGETFLVERDGVALAKISPAGPVGISGAELARRMRDVQLPPREVMESIEEFISNQPNVDLPEWLTS